MIRVYHEYKKVNSDMCTYSKGKKTKTINHISNSNYLLRSVIMGRKFTFSYMYALCKFFKVFILHL